MREIRYCNRCVMNDASDETIRFDDNGFCNYCSNAIKQINTTTYFPNEIGQKKLINLIEKIKKDGQKRKYDCIMGISGGLDSSYLAYLGYKWGLRVLAVHIDDGFDTNISKSNIEKLISKCGFDYLVVKPDEEQFNDLTKAYMLAGVPDLAIPQDNILFAFLYEEVRKNKIKYFLSGGNFALESILQQGNTYNAMDVVNIKDIHRRFGQKPINKLKFLSSYRKYVDMKIVGLKTVRPLDYIDYRRNKAFAELKDFCDFQYYGSKHLENILTAFVQLYWFPLKFGVDKRSSHLSSMIVSGQISRTEAMKILQMPLYDEKMMSNYIEFIKSRLNITDREFNEIMNSPVHSHEDYRTDRLARFLRKIIR